MVQFLFTNNVFFTSIRVCGQKKVVAMVTKIHTLKVSWQRNVMTKFQSI